MRTAGRCPPLRLTSPTPANIRETIEEVTENYSVNEWVIEQNAFQLFLTTDENIQAYLRNKGVAPPTYNV